MKLIAGLGNPGSTYESTRHNVGCETVRRLARHRRVIWAFDHLRHGFVYGNWPSQRPQAKLMVPIWDDSKTQEGVPIMMNQSGEALAIAVNTWRVSPPQEVLIVCDDVNLPLGTLRLKPRGSDGGHHGLASCFEVLGTDEVPRLRIGVGSQPLPKDLTEFVLSPFEASERPIIRHAIERAVEACELWAREGIEVAMNRANTATP